MRQRRWSIAPALLIVIQLLASNNVFAYAANGCQQVNSGAWNGPIQSFDIGATLSGFESGDRLTFTVSGNGQLALLASSGGGYSAVLIVNPPGTATYTVIVGSMSFRPLNDAVAGPLMVTATCTPNEEAAAGLTRGFLASRINGILLNNPGSTSLINRSQTTGPSGVASAGSGATNVASNAAAFGSATAFGNAMGLGASLGDATSRGASRFDDTDEAALGPQRLSFRNSLSQLRREAAERRAEQDRMALGAGDAGGALPLVYETYSPWDVWVEGRYSGFNDDTGNFDRDGHVGVLYLGSDYRITPDMIVGGLVQFDWAKDESSPLVSKVDGSGWMIGPYLSARVHENIYFDLRAAWGRSSNDIDDAGASGSFDTTRWLVRGALAGNWQYYAWRITPSAELAYIKESSDSYTNSGGTFVAAQDVALGRLQFGPEVGYRFVHSADSFIEPFGAIRGVWDFDNPNVAIIDGYVVGPGDFWGRLEGGINWVTSSGLFVRGSATWDGMGAGAYNGYSLQGTINVPLN